MGKIKYCRLCFMYFRKAKRLGLRGYVMFTDQIEKTDTCWLWTGILTPTGYGLFRTKIGYVVMAHRASYEHYVRPVRAGMTIDHLCRVRNCVNPQHLEQVTQAENNRRMQAAKKYKEDLK